LYVGVWGIFATSCSLDLTNYPFDTQTCAITFENWAYLQQDVNLLVEATEVSLEDFQDNGLWHYVGSAVDAVRGGCSMILGT
jgi:hypothetical protein